MAVSRERPLRADAQRNREAVLASAARAFTECGLDATLEGIAKDAGVGIGTLYRHFPTREALIVATYRQELTAVCEAAAELLRAEASPAVALRAWTDRFIEYLTRKLGMADALCAVIASGADPYEQSRELLVSAVQLLLDAGIDAGELRADVSAEDLMMGVGGVGMVTGDNREQAARLLDLLMDGLRL